MGYSDKFRLKAQQIILKFTEELGKSKYYLKLDTSTYDPETGEQTDNYQENDLYIAFDESLVGLFSNKSLVTNPENELLKETKLAFIAGLDVSFEPKADDLIQPVGDTKRYRIKHVEKDMYKALYTCFVSRIPE